MKTSTDLLFRLFAEYTGVHPSTEFKAPFYLEAPLNVKYLEISKDLVVVIEVKPDSTALDGSEPSDSYIRFTVSLKIWHKGAIPRGTRYSFDRTEPYLYIGSVESGQKNQPPDLKVVFGTIKLVPGSGSDLSWTYLCQRIANQAFHLAEELMKKETEVPASVPT